MVVSSFYNKANKVLILSLGKDSKNKKIIKNKISQIANEEVLIYDTEDKLIGVNLLGYENEKLIDGIVNQNLIMEVISNYFKGEIEAPYVVGYVKSKEKHPKSEKLNICQVDLGKNEVQIVCGAKNVGENMKVIVSQVDAVMPNGLIIKPSKLIDEPSNGMITSLSELGLSEDNTQGIAILDDSYTIGEAYHA